MTSLEAWLISEGTRPANTALAPNTSLNHNQNFMISSPSAEWIERQPL
jgi:hypothetical protein